MSELIGMPFNAESTAAEVISDIDLGGKRVVVTGASSGIGVETARALASANAEVTLAVRNVEAGTQVAKEITESTGNATVQVRELDLASPSSVRVFVADWSGPLHILVNNAGVMAAPLERTAEGWELQLAVNHLGHFALSVGLHDALAEAQGARVVSLSSPAHLANPVNFDDLNWNSRDYNRWAAYGEAKSANVLFAVQATELWNGDGIFANALSPGGIQTNLQRYATEEELANMRAAAESGALVWKTIEQGAATSVLVAASPLVDGVGGRYFEDAQEAGPNEPGTRRGVAAHALDRESATRLWKASADLIANR